MLYDAENTVHGGSRPFGDDSSLRADLPVVDDLVDESSALWCSHTEVG